MPRLTLGRHQIMFKQTENRIANNTDKEVLNEESVKVCSHWAVQVIIRW